MFGVTPRRQFIFPLLGPRQITRPSLYKESGGRRKNRRCGCHGSWVSLVNIQCTFMRLGKFHGQEKTNSRPVCWNMTPSCGKQHGRGKNRERRKMDNSSLESFPRTAAVLRLPGIGIDAAMCAAAVQLKLKSLWFDRSQVCVILCCQHGAEERRGLKSGFERCG